MRVLDGVADLLAQGQDLTYAKAAAHAVVAHEAAGLDQATARQVAAVVQLLTSAAAWQALRDYWDMDGAESAETVAVGLTMLLAGARAEAQTPERRRRRPPRSSSTTGASR